MIRYSNNSSRYYYLVCRMPIYYRIFRDMFHIWVLLLPNKIPMWCRGDVSCLQLSTGCMQMRDAASESLPFQLIYFILGMRCSGGKNSFPEGLLFAVLLSHPYWIVWQWNIWAFVGSEFQEVPKLMASNLLLFWKWKTWYLGVLHGLRHKLLFTFDDE